MQSQKNLDEDSPASKAPTRRALLFSPEPTKCNDSKPLTPITPTTSSNLEIAISPSTPPASSSLRVPFPSPSSFLFQITNTLSVPSPSTFSISVSTVSTVSTVATVPTVSTVSTPAPAVSCISPSKSFPSKAGDTSKGRLPTVENGSYGIRRVSVDTVADLIKGHYKQYFSNFYIIDTRYDYEYKGGHITNAISMTTKKQIKSFYESHRTYRSSVVIFHCEFSKNRGPKSCYFFRHLDRMANTYPTLNFPDLYVMDGGYKAFFAKYSFLCSPQAYVSMWDPTFSQICKQRTKQFRKLWSDSDFECEFCSLSQDYLTKSVSVDFGTNMCNEIKTSSANLTQSIDDSEPFDAMRCIHCGELSRIEYTRRIYRRRKRTHSVKASFLSRNNSIV